MLNGRSCGSVLLKGMMHRLEASQLPVPVSMADTKSKPPRLQFSLPPFGGRNDRCRVDPSFNCACPALLRGIKRHPTTVSEAAGHVGAAHAM